MGIQRTLAYLVRGQQRADTLGNTVRHGFCFRLVACTHLDDGKDHREQVLHAVIEFASEQVGAVARFAHCRRLRRLGFGARGSGNEPRAEQDRHEDQDDEAAKQRQDTRFEACCVGGLPRQYLALDHAHFVDRPAQAFHRFLAFIGKDRTTRVEKTSILDQHDRFLHFGELRPRKRVDLVEQFSLADRGLIAQQVAQAPQ